jgi:threonine dehydrogenase-like Zn-dependent dehydrogenase
VIAGLGAAVTGVAVGDIVFVNPVVSCGRCRPCVDGRTNLCDNLVGVGSHIPGGMADAFNVPASTALLTSPPVSPLAASLIEPAATAARAAARAGDLAGKTVAVLGASTIGLLTIGMTTAAGAARLVATDLSADKRSRSIRWGADAAIDGGDEDVVEGVLVAAGRKPEVVFDCVGSPGTFGLALDLVDKAGTVCVVGADHGSASLRLDAVQDGEVTITGVAMYTAFDFARAAAYVADNVELVSSLVSAEFPVSNAAEAFGLAASGAAVKVQLVGMGGAPCAS